MADKFSGLAEKLAMLGALQNVINGDGAEMKMAQIVAWIIHHKFNGKLHLTPAEYKQMRKMNHIAIIGTGSDEDGLTFTSKQMGAEEEEKDDVCRCGRCKGCGQKHD